MGICFIAEILWETMIPHANFHWCRIIGCWVIHHVFLSEQIKMMMMMMMMIRLPNFVEIGPSSADIWYIDFQDGGRWGPISLTVTDRVMPLSLKGPYLSANQMSYNWIHVWVIATFGWKNKRPPYWNSTSGFGVDHITVLGMSFCTRYQILSKSDYPLLYRFSRWRPLRRNFTPGFGFCDVAVFRRSVSITKPSFIVITQSTTEI